MANQYNGRNVAKYFILSPIIKGSFFCLDFILFIFGSFWLGMVASQLKRIYKFSETEGRTSINGNLFVFIVLIVFKMISGNYEYKKRYRIESGNCRGVALLNVIYKLSARLCRNRLNIHQEHGNGNKNYISIPNLND